MVLHRVSKYAWKTETCYYETKYSSNIESSTAKLYNSKTMKDDEANHEDADKDS